MYMGVEHSKRVRHVVGFVGVAILSGSERSLIHITVLLFMGVVSLNTLRVCETYALGSFDRDQHVCDLMVHDLPPFGEEGFGLKDRSVLRP